MTSNRGGSVYEESALLSQVAVALPYRTDRNDEEKTGRAANRNAQTDCLWDLHGWVGALFSHTANHANGAECIGGREKADEECEAAPSRK